MNEERKSARWVGAGVLYLLLRAGVSQKQPSAIFFLNKELKISSFQFFYQLKRCLETGHVHFV